MALKLYAHPFSSYCQKAFVAFYEMNVPFDLQLLSSENPRAGEKLKAMWPLERFPVLVADGRTLLETTVIIEWLDQHFPWTMRLIPSDPDQALEVRMYDRIFDNYVMTPMQTIVFDRIRPEDAHDDYGTGQARAMLDKAYAWLMHGWRRVSGRRPMPSRSPTARRPLPCSTPTGYIRSTTTRISWRTSSD
jgi:glutathione S-transferase